MTRGLSSHGHPPAVGAAAGGAAAAGGRRPVGGAAGVTGFVDHHVHFLATAAARLSVDVSAAATVGEVVEAVQAGAAASGPVGAGPGPAGALGWIRAWGYDDALLAERRHPTRDDLDRAAGGRPVVLHHRSGHAAVLSSAALAEVGGAEHSDGVLYDRHDLLARVPRLDVRELEGAAAAVSRDWAAAGVSAFTDATHTNGAAELELLAGWCAAGVVSQEVTAMVGAGRLAETPGFGERVGQVRVGHAKIMPTPASAPGGDPAAPRTLVAAIAAAHRAGFPVAVHVVEVDVLEAVLAGLEASPAPAAAHPAVPGAAARGAGDAAADRIEHNALCLPEHVARIKAAGAVVVVNPSFLTWRRVKYQEQLSPVERSWLVRIRSLVEVGVAVRAGSDSPVTPARPQEMVAAATAHPFCPEESIDRATAFGLLSPLGPL